MVTSLVNSWFTVFVFVVHRSHICICARYNYILNKQIQATMRPNNVNYTKHSQFDMFVLYKIECRLCSLRFSYITYNNFHYYFDYYYYWIESTYYNSLCVGVYCGPFVYRKATNERSKQASKQFSRRADVRRVYCIVRIRDIHQFCCRRRSSLSSPPPPPQSSYSFHRLMCI